MTETLGCPAWGAAPRKKLTHRQGAGHLPKALLRRHGALEGRKRARRGAPIKPAVVTPIITHTVGLSKQK